MSTAGQVLLAISGLFLFWQIILVILAANLVRSGRYRQVHISMWPGLIGFVALLGAIFTH
ncbi:hypothetical protein PP459_gp078 [Streptomyces phage Wakanda]|uniref:Uncharacterized protein n=2 Tax=Wakandavirus TaxID=3044854 RepID=A0A6G8R437_9CAUD|nr:hypothetical protein PP459_gp078 [Streptomyces phage Wakanda]YP_010652474.1 hypothetical protein PP460_gp084 [Streptomyces phage Muntaha]QIN94155.1 hypothetical protein SEA_WAKANDA_194 [Streptomyces phage Wakanda]QIN94718.1 hypothetical protein SEA_MUNTAHA_194 [Streptomyces phage Muntaha]